MSRPYIGDHDMEEILRLTGEDVFAGRGRDRGSLRNYRYDSGLSEGVQPLDVRTLLEETTPMTDEQVVAVLNTKLAPLLKDRVWRVTSEGGGVLSQVKTVVIEAYSYSNDRSTWTHGVLQNAPTSLRMTISYWENGVPVKVGGTGKTMPTGGIVELKLVSYRGAVSDVKPRQMKGTPDKVVAAVVKWFQKNAEIFTGAPTTAAEDAWQHAFPTVNPVDDLLSWANARDDKYDKTPAGVMGESAEPSFAGLVLDLEYNPDLLGGRVTVTGKLTTQQAALTAVQQRLSAEFGKTEVKRTSGEWSLLVKAGKPTALIAALRSIGTALGMKLSKTLRESRKLSLRDLAESGGRYVRRLRRPTPAQITDSPKKVVEDLAALLKSLGG